MRARTGRRCNSAGSLTSKPVNGFTLPGREIETCSAGEIFLKYSTNGAIVQTVIPPPEAELFGGDFVAGACVGSGEGSVVAVGSAVAVGINSVDLGFKVAAGMGVRVGRRVGAGVGVGSALHAPNVMHRVMQMMNTKMPRGM